MIKKKAKVVFFGNEEHKEIIEATGSEFRHYSYFPTKEIQRISNDSKYQKLFIPIFAEYISDVSLKILPELIETVDQEKPDLIIYDSISVHSKYLMEYLKSCKQFQPASLIFSPTFTSSGKIYPNSFEMQILHERKTIFYYYYLLKAFIKQIYLSVKFGLKIHNPVTFLSNVNENELNLVAIFPELQARSNLCSKNVKFVGCCINETVRSIQSLNLDKSLLNVLGMFNEKNPIRLDVDDYFLSDKSISLNNKKLVYVSLGTLFNGSFPVFDRILKAFQNLEEIEQDSQLALRNVFVIVSCGFDVYKMFQEKIHNNEYYLPENVLLLKNAPQIEILKRADLFISHCGMNSTSEAIHYGVPIVGIPILADQPRVAYRVLDELGFGIRLSVYNLEPNMIRNAVYRVLNDKVYFERILRYSKISRKYDGTKNSVLYAIEHIESRNKKNN